MSKKVTDIVAYLTPLGLILAFIFGDRENSRFHLNQALVLCLADIVISIVNSLLGRILLVGTLVSVICGILSLALLVLWIIGIASAISGTEKEVPVLGVIKLL